MKKAILVLAMLVAGIPTLASAAGYYSPGFVSAGSNYMYGTYNVRYNTTAAAPLISALTIALIQPWGFTDTTVAAITSLATCLRAYVPTSSAMHYAATEIKNGAGSGNGTYLYILRNTATNECTYISSSHISYYVD